MMTCEEHEILISTFLDGELSREEAAAMLDHLVGCESCRAFYREAQGLQETVRPLTSGRRNPPPAELWDRIESRARPRRALAGRLLEVSGWGWKAAAVLLVAFGLWQIGRIQTGQAPRVPPGEESRPVEVVLGGQPGRMTDARFVELTTELLGAGPRYRQAMLQVMREVQESTWNRESPAEDILPDQSHTNSEQPGESPRTLPS